MAVEESWGPQSLTSAAPRATGDEAQPQTYPYDRARRPRIDAAAVDVGMAIRSESHRCSAFYAVTFTGNVVSPLNQFARSSRT